MLPKVRKSEFVIDANIAMKAEDSLILCGAGESHAKVTINKTSLHTLNNLRMAKIDPLTQHKRQQTLIAATVSIILDLFPVFITNLFPCILFFGSIASIGSDASSSICSANGMTEATTATIWPKLFDARSPNTVSLAHSINSNDEELVTSERVEEEFIDDVITNDFVIIDGIVLHRNDLEQQQLSYSNSNATSVMLNDSSNEVRSINIQIATSIQS